MFVNPFCESSQIPMYHMFMYANEHSLEPMDLLVLNILLKYAC